MDYIQSLQCILVGQRISQINQKFNPVNQTTQEVSFEQLNRLIKLIQQRQEDYLILLQNFKRKKEIVKVTNENQQKIYSTIRDNQFDRGKQEKSIIDQFKGMRSEDSQVYRFITRICQIHQYENQKLQSENLYDSLQDSYITRFNDILRKYMEMSPLQVQNVILFIINFTRSKIKEELNKGILLNYEEKCDMAKSNPKIQPSNSRSPIAKENCNSNKELISQTSDSKNQINNTSSGISQPYSQVIAESPKCNNNNINQNQNLSTSPLPNTHVVNDARNLSGVQIKRSLNEQIKAGKLISQFYDKVYSQIYQTMDLDKFHGRSMITTMRINTDSNEKQYLDLLMRNKDVKSTVLNYQERTAKFLVKKPDFKSWRRTGSHSLSDIDLFKYKGKSSIRQSSLIIKKQKKSFTTVQKETGQEEECENHISSLIEPYSELNYQIDSNTSTLDTNIFSFRGVNNQNNFVFSTNQSCTHQKQVENSAKRNRFKAVSAVPNQPISPKSNNQNSNINSDIEFEYQKESAQKTSSNNKAAEIWPEYNEPIKNCSIENKENLNTELPKLSINNTTVVPSQNSIALYNNIQKLQSSSTIDQMIMNNNSTNNQKPVQLAAQQLNFQSVSMMEAPNQSVQYHTKKVNDHYSNILYPGLLGMNHHSLQKEPTENSLYSEQNAYSEKIHNIASKYGQLQNEDQSYSQNMILMSRHMNRNPKLRPLLLNNQTMKFENIVPAHMIDSQLDQILLPSDLVNRNNISRHNRNSTSETKMDQVPILSNEQNAFGDINSYIQSNLRNELELQKASLKQKRCTSQSPFIKSNKQAKTSNRYKGDG